MLARFLPSQRLAGVVDVAVAEGAGQEEGLLGRGRGLDGG